ncbi:MAG TPA: hypothetical protein VLI69_08570 [Gammaproteobacteria bacterium]|nr:hypothetical protein [Gammaproteobacteria bacterium]
MHISKIFSSLFLGILFVKPCFSEMAQEVTIPGYNPSPASVSSVSQPTSTTALPAKPPSVIQKIPFPIPATQDELNQLFESINLKGWSAMSSYLWTCTRSSFSVPMYNAKNSIQAEFDKIKKEKKTLTLKSASEITQEFGKPVSHVIAGLYGQYCRIIISVSNIPIPRTLNCLVTIREARYLSTLAPFVAENTGKSEPLPSDVFNAIQNLLDSRCNKKLIP